MAKAKDNGSNFFTELAVSIKDEDTDIAGKSAAEFDGWLDTTSYALNAQVSGSIYGGIPNNKVTAIAGDPATGKTFFALSMMTNFLRDNPTGGVVYFDTEAAVTRQMMVDRGIDADRVIISQPVTVQQFRHTCLNILEKYMERSSRPPMLMVLDSLGQLSTTKEITDIAEGKDTRDMTRAQLIRGTFRAISLALAKARVPLIITNHTYETMGLYAQKEMGGGSGLKYAASTVLFLSKAKDRDVQAGPVTGVIITSTAVKSRFTIPDTKVKAKLSFTSGLNRYYGLADLAVESGLWKKVSKKIQVSDGTMHFESQIYKNAPKYFTSEVLDKIDAYTKQVFCYGSGVDSVEDEVEEDENEVENVE